MSGTQQGHRAAARSAAYGTGPEARTGWLGWVYFAGIMMIMLGFFQAIDGLVAIFDDTFYLVTEGGLIVSLDYTVWGWVHLIIGLVAFVAGYAVMTGKTWGRATGIILAVLSALVNMAFIGAYPFWSIIIITMDVIIIYALAVHGQEAKS
jgi:hypothetical protein